MDEGRSWLVYGGGAVSGAVVEQLVDREIPVIVAGRNEERVRAFARNAGIRYRVGDVDNAPGLLKNVAGVVNTAGRFRETAPLLMEACVRAGVHYVDVSNEADVHMAAWSLSDRAREAGIGVASGAGVGTWFAERLIHALKAEVDQPVSALLVTLPSGSVSKSPGVAASQNTVVSARAVALVDARIQPVRRRVRQLSAGIGPRAALLVGTGDVIALAQSSGLRTVAAAAGIDAHPGLLRWGLPLITAKARWLASRPDQRRDDIRDAPGSMPSDALRVRLLADVLGANGGRARGRLSSRSGTAVAARAAIAAMETLLEGALAGTYTAFQVLGDRSLGDEFDPLIEIEDRPGR